MAHFHIPKPLHGWREFAGEVGIIVLGVLIALTAEQIVQEFHWRAETRAARAALLSEARDNLLSAQFRQKQTPCVERRLGEIAEVFRQHSAGRPIKLTRPVRRPIPLGATHNAWDVAVSSQAVGHMDLAEKLKFADAFFNYQYWDQIQNREQEVWLTLGLLDDPTILSDNDWPVLHQAYAQARSLNVRIGIISNGVLTNLNLGQTPSPLELSPTARAGVMEFCRAILTVENRPR
jgi:hypothetical protein